MQGEMNKYGYMDDPKWKKLYNAHVANYKSDDPGYSNARAEMTKIQNDYQAKRAQEMCWDIIRYIRNNATPNNLLLTLITTPFIIIITYFFKIKNKNRTFYVLFLYTFYICII